MMLNSTEMSRSRIALTLGGERAEEVCGNCCLYPRWGKEERPFSSASSPAHETVAFHSFIEKFFNKR